MVCWMCKCNGWDFLNFEAFAIKGLPIYFSTMGKRVSLVSLNFDCLNSENWGENKRLGLKGLIRVNQDRNCWFLKLEISIQVCRESNRKTSFNLGWKSY